MGDQKQTGSYYTPEKLVEFMICYLIKEQQDFSNVLEPSAGDGRFLSLLLPLSGHVDAVEIFEEKVSQMDAQYRTYNLEVKKDDFVKYSLEQEIKYSLIVGNPPYINIKTMEKTSVSSARELCKEEGLESTIMQNMWLAFVIGACRMLRPGGTIFFVLPMEFLQVQYAEKLREYLEKRFNTIHIISFQSFVFSDIEQEICLVYLTNKVQSLPYILYEVYEDTESRMPLIANTIKKNKPLRKWSNAILADGDILLLKEKSRDYPKINDIGITAPGIVTGGNKYFILTTEQVDSYQCEQYVLPILQKSSFVTDNTIKIDDEVFSSIKNKNKPVYLLNLSKVQENNLPPPLATYLEWAGSQKIQNIELKERYKCSKRKPWYGVPIVSKGDIIFFKRYDVLPRFYMNDVNIHTTDAGYHIRLYEQYDKESVVFCFFNSMTLAQCEFNGRYYGGGVCELVPSEFKEIALPYRKIDPEDIELLVQMFNKKIPVNEVVKFVNSRTIDLDMDQKQIVCLETIRRRLIGRRRDNKHALEQ